MQLTAYENAVKELAVPKLNAFLGEQKDIVEIDDWSTFKAKEKREALLEAFKQSKPLREQFVAYYAEVTGNESDFSEWETSDLPDDGGAEEEPKAESTPKGNSIDPEDSQPTTTEVAQATNYAPGKAPAFVEGAFAQIVSDVAGMDAHDSDQNLREMEDNLEFEHLRMGVLLSHIQKSNHYVTLGYDNMREYLAAHTGLHYRKAMFLISNANVVQELDIPAKELKGVSWSGLRHIVPVLNKENYKTWLEAARTLTHAALIDEVRTEVAKQQGALPAPDKEEGKPTEKAIGKTFNLFPEQKAIVDAAIEKAKIEGNVGSPAVALEFIAASYTGKPPSDTSISQVLPDLSDDGFNKMFSKVKADEGQEGAVRLLNLVAALWPEIDINVSIPNVAAAE